LQDDSLTDVERQLLGAPDRAVDGSIAKGAGAMPLHRLRGNFNRPMRTGEDSPPAGNRADENRPDAHQSPSTLKEPAQ